MSPCFRYSGKRKFNENLTDHRIHNFIYPKEITEDQHFHESNAQMGMFDTLEMLKQEELLKKDSWNWKITPKGRKILSNPTNYWENICNEELDSHEETLLKIVNENSPQLNENPLFGWLKETTQDDFLSSFGINSLERNTNEQMEILHRYVYGLPELLKQRGFLKVNAMVQYHTSLKPTYSGLVWSIKRGLTIESKFIDELVKEWETTNVDFKREISLGTKKQKAEFAKDILGLVTTKSSGKRYMIIGFDDKTRKYFSPPDPKITQNQMEHILSNLTEPIVNIRYEVVDYRLGKVGKLEVIREPEKLPYKAKQDVVIDEKKTLGLKKDTVYVRHGSQTEHPTDLELSSLEEEGKRSREEV